MSLPENQRQEFLQAMGITSYFPRLRLPGAPEPVQCEWPAEWQPARTAGTGEADAVVQVSPVPAEEKGKATGVQTEIEPEIEPEKEIEIEKVSTTAGTAEAIRFQCLCIRVNRDLAILNAMPYMGAGHLIDRHWALLVNLLRAAGIPHGDMQAEEKPFRWPLLQGDHVDSSRPAAAVALVAYLQQKLADWQFSRLLVMGELAIAPVFTLEDGEEGVTLDSQAWETAYTRSLDEILQRPALKKEVWAQTGVLRG